MRVITFSTRFPAKHPKKGEPTFFVEKIWDGLGLVDNEYTDRLPEARLNFIRRSSDIIWPKGHTIRAGEHWPDGKLREVGDWFSPRIWSGKPYASKQIEFAPPIQIKKIWKIRIEILDAFTFWLNDKNLPTDKVVELAKNDGLAVNDFFNWFLIHPKQKTSVFYGQILCWTNSIEY